MARRACTACGRLARRSRGPADSSRAGRSGRRACCRGPFGTSARECWRRSPPPDCCRYSGDHGSGIQQASLPRRRSCSSAPTGGSCSALATHPAAPKDQLIAFSRELNQVGLHHVHDHRRRSARRRSTSVDPSPGVHLVARRTSEDRDRSPFQVEVGASQGYQLTPPQPSECCKQHQRR
jgi:hypothetical protein